MKWLIFGIILSLSHSTFAKVNCSLKKGQKEIYGGYLMHPENKRGERILITSKGKVIAPFIVDSVRSDLEIAGLQDSVIFVVKRNSNSLEMLQGEFKILPGQGSNVRLEMQSGVTSTATTHLALQNPKLGLTLSCLPE